jgi:ligand-binding sensor domain-containing protein
MRFSPILILFLFLSSIIKIYGQDSYNFKFKTYTYNDGLVHNYTKKCLQDNKGFIWIITQHGLSRFDGVNFKNFEHNPSDSNSLPQNDLEDIAIDANDRIWLSYKKGLCYYDQNRHSFVKIYFNRQPFESHSVFFDKKRNCIWSVNITNYAKIDGKTMQLQSFDFKEKQPANEHINRILLDSKDRLWIPYARSNYRCIDLQHSTEYLHKEYIEPTSFYEDDDKNIWITTWHQGLRLVTVTDSIHVLNRYGNRFIKIDEEYTFISTGIASSKTLGGKNIFWISLSTYGVLLFDRVTKTAIHEFKYDANNKNGISTDFTEWVFCDRDNNIWLCTWHGIIKVNAKEQQFISWELPELKGEFYNCIAGIAEDPSYKNYYWMAATGSGIIQYDRNTKKIEKRYYYYYDSDTKALKGEDKNYDWRWTTNLFKDSYNQLWSTTYGGLIKIKNGQVSSLKLTNKKGNILYPKESKEIGKGNIWVLAETGIFKVNALTDEYIFYQDTVDKKNIFYDIELLDSSNLILASDAGVKLFNTRTQRFTTLISSIQKLMNVEIIGNKLYLGGMTGFAMYDLDTKKITSLGKSAGIEKVQENRLRKDSQDNLWIYTSHGLFRYYSSKGNFEEFTPKDGIYDLSDDYINFFSYQKQFYIGYRMAITSFDPLKVNVNSEKVNPVISELYVNNNLLPFSIDSLKKTGLQLSYHENQLRINYTAPDFTNPDKIIFSYQLDGFDTSWISAGTRRGVTYNNLPSGKYTFRLKAANSSGLWNEEAIIFRFTISAPFWQTWWFRLGIITLISCLIYFLYRYRLKQIKKIYEVRSNISRSLHDEVGATLSSINIYSDVARTKTNDPDIKQLVDKVYNASANAMENMSDIVWYVNPQNDLLENLLIRMREYALPLLEARGIGVVFEAKENIEDLKTTMQQRHHLYLIFKEAVNNALKYSKAQNITIQLAREGNWIKMDIRDDGKGFNALNNYSGNGIKNMYYRAKAISGELNVNSIDGNGSQVTLRFPIT